MTRGALLLAKYLEAHEMRRATFAATLGVAPPLVTMWLSPDPNKRRTPGRVNALAIERVTRGTVPASTWDDPAPAVKVAKRGSKVARPVVRRRAGSANEHSPKHDV